LTIGTLSLLYTEKNPNEFQFLKETSDSYIFIIDKKNLNLYTYQNPASDFTIKYRKYTDLASTLVVAQQEQQRYLTNTIKFNENLSYLFIADSTNSIIIQWKLIKN
jgi:hypothetical protein